MTAICLDDQPLMCETPEDCPLGPDSHPFVPPLLVDGLCCCKQPWEVAR